MSHFSSFLLTAVLSCGTILLTESSANAQRGGRGGGRGGGGAHFSSGAHSSGGHYSGGGHYYGHSYGGYYRQPGYYLRSPGYYGYGRYSNYYAPGTVIYEDDEPTYVPDYAEGTPETPAPEVSAESTSPTRLTVILPESRGALWVDGLKIDSPSRNQSVEFPDESPGRMYPHKVTATFDRDGRTVTEERQVRISGGKASVVDFTRPTGSTSKVPPKPEPEYR